MPSFPKVEGGRDFDEEVEDRIRLTHAYNQHITDSNTRALSARAQYKSQDLESSGAISGISGVDHERKKKKTEKIRRDSKQNDRLAGMVGLQSSQSRLHFGQTRVKFSMAKHRQ